MEITLVKENEDGSADYTMNLSEEEHGQLIRFAFVEMLKRGMEEGKKYEPSELSMGDTKCGTPNCKDGTGEQSCESGQCSYCNKSS
jgi:hypothetical protein